MPQSAPSSGWMGTFMKGREGSHPVFSMVTIWKGIQSWAQIKLTKEIQGDSKYKNNPILFKRLESLRNYKGRHSFNRKIKFTGGTIEFTFWPFLHSCSILRGVLQLGWLMNRVMVLKPKKKASLNTAVKVSPKIPVTSLISVLHILLGY